MQNHVLPLSVEGTTHSKLKWYLRLDVWPFVVVHAMAFVWGMDDSKSLPVRMLIPCLALVGHLIVSLSSLYSTKAYVVLALTSPVLTDPMPGDVLCVKMQCKTKEIKHLALKRLGASDVWVFDHERRQYELITSTPSTTENGLLKTFQLVHAPDPKMQPLSTYADRLIKKDDRNASVLLSRHGENRFDIPLPESSRLVLEQVQSPFFLFQVFCVLLWMLDEYWYFAFFTLIMLIMFEVIVAQNRRRNLESAREMLRPAHMVWVKRAGSWRRISSWQLVPLDVVFVIKDHDNPFPCDALIVRGICVVNEAMLTGESTPKTKESLYSPGEVVDFTKPLPTTPEESRFVLLGGTLVLDAQIADGSTAISALQAEDEDFPCQTPGSVVVVMRTGYETTQGELMRVILHATERVTVDSNREAYAFMAILVIVATLAASYVLYQGSKDEKRSQWKLFLHCIMIVTSVVPPELPMELSLAVTTSLSNLIKKHAVYCTEPYRIPLAGKIDVCCFDKTGTLTSDDLQVETLVTTRQTDALDVLSFCHSLVAIDNRVLGDTTETALWRFLNNRVVVSPDNNGVTMNRFAMKSNEEPNAVESIVVLKRFQFDAELKRMSVLVARTMLAPKTPGHRASFYLYCKGAPETLESLLVDAPADYASTYKKLASQGFRVLGLAVKKLNDSNHDVMKLFRSQIESDLHYVGLVALSSPLKIDSADVVKELQHSGHRVVMITGDNDATAREVARQLGIPALEENTLTGKQLLHLEQTVENEKQIARALREKYVFARVSPAQKELILDLFEKDGLTTLMCGDGTNDVGALKRADVGVSVVSDPSTERHARNVEKSKFGKNAHSIEALLQEDSSAQVRLGDASIASPFTAKSPHVSCVLDIVRQGRCTLVTTIQMFKILAANGLLHSWSMTVLYLKGVRQGDAQSTMFGLVVAVVFALLSFTEPLKVLAPRRPTTKIFSYPVIASIVGQSFVHLMTLIACTSLVEMGDSAESSLNDVNANLTTANSTALDPDAAFSPNALNTAVYICGYVLQANVFAVNYRGDPFMTPFWANKKFSRILVFMWGTAFFLASGLAPSFVLGLLELVVLPSNVIPLFIGILLADTLISLGWEKFIVRDVLGG